VAFSGTYVPRAEFREAPTIGFINPLETQRECIGLKERKKERKKERDTQKDT